MIVLQREPVDYTRLCEQVRSRRAGAVCLFLGTAREFTGEKQTQVLEYEAYSAMAQAKLGELEQEARARWRLVEVAITHRLGRLELGEIAVAIAVSAPHRAEAFEACQWLMDTIKQLVPIWKKEEWADGTSEWIHPETTLEKK